MYVLCFIFNVINVAIQLGIFLIIIAHYIFMTVPRNLNDVSVVVGAFRFKSVINIFYIECKLRRSDLIDDQKI